MRRNSYFILASLPPLLFGEPPPVSIEWFLELCQANLADEDWALVRDCQYRADPNIRFEHHLQHRWHCFDIGVRNEVLKLRSAALGWNEFSYLKPADSLDSAMAMEYIRAAFDADSPLDAEMSLYRLRWLYIEEISGFTPFTIEQLMAYHLRLQLLTDKALISEAQGAQRFEALYHDIQRRSPRSEHAITRSQGAIL